VEKTTTWNSKLEGKTYNFLYTKALKSRFMVTHTLAVKNTLTGDSFSTGVEMNRFWSILFGKLDEAFMLDGREAKFVVSNDTPNVTIGGVALRKGSWLTSITKVIAVLALVEGLRGAFSSFNLAFVASHDTGVVFNALLAAFFRVYLIAWAFVYLMAEKIRKTPTRLLILSSLATIAAITLAIVPFALLF